MAADAGRPSDLFSVALGPARLHFAFGGIAMTTPFHFLPAPKAAEEIAPWDAMLGRYSRIVGYTALGDFFLMDPQTSNLAMLLTLEGSVEDTGYHEMEAFVGTFLADSEVVTHVLRPQLVAALEARLGPLGIDEVYYPIPYPFLGGSGAPETFDKGNVWVFASIVGQSWGLPIHEK